MIKPESRGPDRLSDLVQGCSAIAAAGGENCGETVVNAKVISVRTLQKPDKSLALAADKRKTFQRMAVAPEQYWARPRADAVAFTRDELSRILGLYGHFVAAGEWRDYAIDHLKDAAVFSIFRRSAETPLYRVEKRPALGQKQGAFAVVSMTGVILKRGHDLAQVLKVFERQRLRLAE